MKMRFRTDGWHYADLKAFGWTWEGDGEKSYGSTYGNHPDREEYKRQWDSVPVAEPGDVWRVHYGGIGHEGEIAGYAICCPGCRHVHVWSHASNCTQNETTHKWTDDKGVEHEYKMCEHQRNHTSCWNWTGSAEDNNLSATPSLQVTMDKYEPGGYNWHGHITNGDLHN